MKIKGVHNLQEAGKRRKQNSNYDYFCILPRACSIFLFSVFSFNRLIATLAAVQAAKDSAKPAQADRSSIGNQSNRMTKMTMVRITVVKNRIFLRIRARFWIHLSVRKVICAREMITDRRKSCRIVAVEKPWLPRVNREEYSFALSPIVSPNRTKRSRIMPKVANT